MACGLERGKLELGTGNNNNGNRVARLLWLYLSSFFLSLSVLFARDVKLLEEQQEEEVKKKEKTSLPAFCSQFLTFLIPRIPFFSLPFFLLCLFLLT